MLDITKDAQKFIEKLPPKQSKQIIMSIFKLSNNPFPNDYKHLSGHPNCYRIDCGEYRICYKVFEKDVFIIVIGIRNDDDVYKKIERKI